MAAAVFVERVLRANNEHLRSATSLLLLMSNATVVNNVGVEHELLLDVPDPTFLKLIPIRTNETILGVPRRPPLQLVVEVTFNRLVDHDHRVDEQLYPVR